MHLESLKVQFPEFAQEIETLEKQGFQSRNAAWIESLNSELAISACWLLGKSSDTADADLLLKVLAGQRRDLWMQAATDLSLVANADHLKAMVSMLETSQDPQRREAILYGLAFAFSAETAVEAQVTNAFIHIANQPHERPLVRAQAFEGIANHLGVTDADADLLPASIYDRAAEVTLKCLTDVEPEVRFWACFAAGQLRLHQAIPQLQQLAQHDPAIAQDFWSVSEEAEDAITLIQGHSPPERTAYSANP